MNNINIGNYIQWEHKETIGSVVIIKTSYGIVKEVHGTTLLKVKNVLSGDARLITSFTYLYVYNENYVHKIKKEDYDKILQANMANL